MKRNLRPRWTLSTQSFLVSPSFPWWAANDRPFTSSPAHSDTHVELLWRLNAWSDDDEANGPLQAEERIRHLSCGGTILVLSCSLVNGKKSARGIDGLPVSICGQTVPRATPRAGAAPHTVSVNTSARETESSGTASAVILSSGPKAPIRRYAPPSSRRYTSTTRSSWSTIQYSVTPKRS